MKGLMFIFAGLCWLFTLRANAQGCVAVRSTGGSACGLQSGMNQPAGGWQITASYRNFKSFRHFRGKEEETIRVENGSDVRNYTNNLDLGITRFLGNRWSLSLFVPFQSTSRSSLYEHDGKTRHFTSATGLGDLRLSVAAWLLEPNKAGNLQAAVGIKFPTGDYQYQDYFFKNDSTQLLGPVDQSIQLGDGGTGFSLELNGYWNIFKSLSFYGNGFYLINPREQNGVSTGRGSTPSATAIKYGTATMSVADQYMMRAGFNAAWKGLSLSAGIRYEGIPSHDLIGGNWGFRRPGYIGSIEPGIAYQKSGFQIFASVPVALDRNRVQSYSDELRTRDSGTKVIGDAAFADYSINVGFTVRLGSLHHPM